MARPSNRFARLLRLLPLLSLVPLAACASERDRFPSLEIRPAERAFGQAQAAPAAESVPAVPVPPPGAPLPERLAALQARAKQTSESFAALLPEAQRAAAAARGAARDSDVWARGQLALARLASARSDTAIVLADLDQLAVEAEIAAIDQPTIDAQTIAGARDSVVARIAEEDAALARLQG